MPFCFNCSHAVSAKATRCTFCGASLENPSVSKEQTSESASSGPGIVLASRYKDAYVVATVTDGFGKLVKGAGVTIATVLILLGLFVATNRRLGDASAVLGVVAMFFGIFAGILFYLLGVLVSAQAQILKASLDSAVNTSPFLSNEHRARIMSNPAS